MPTTCQSLIVRLQSGSDRVSWDEFFDVYHPYLVRFVESRGLRGADVSDVVQNIFMRLMKALGRARYQPSRGKFRSWLRRIAERGVIDWHRKRRRESTHAMPMDVADSQVPVDFDWEAEHRRTVLKHAIAVIRSESVPQTWECFERHVLQQIPAPSVAISLGVSTNSVYVNSFRVVTRIRETCHRFAEDLRDDCASTVSR
ncbi:MAG: sigma-70 family RNA polymerase sigma factor [Planctomycetaceae bacterium]